VSVTNQIDMFPAAEAKIGHNLGPELPEIDLDGWTDSLLLRAQVLVEQAANTTVADHTSVQEATLLAGLIRDHVDLIEAERKETKAPYLAKTREIDNKYNTLKAMLALYNQKGAVVSGPLFNILRQIKAYQDEQQRIQEEEQRRIQEELRRKREEQEAAARAQREKEEALKREQAEKIRAEELEQDEKIRAERAAQIRAEREQTDREQAERQVEIEKLERQADHAAAPQPIRSVYGVSAHRRPVYKVEIVDMTAALRWCRKLNEAALLAVVKQIYEAQVRAGVRDLPGAKVTSDSAPVIRRR